jgi:hypothetical protein
MCCTAELEHVTALLFDLVANARPAEGEPEWDARYYRYAAAWDAAQSYLAARGRDPFQSP